MYLFLRVLFFSSLPFLENEYRYGLRDFVRSYIYGTVYLCKIYVRTIDARNPFNPAVLSPHVMPHVAVSVILYV